jgi:hypothetical protein
VEVLANGLRRTNLASALANCYVSGGARHANIFPMMMLNGQFPRDFQMPRTVDQLRMMDCKTPFLRYTYLSKVNVRSKPPKWIASSPTIDSHTTTRPSLAPEVCLCRYTRVMVARGIASCRCCWSSWGRVGLRIRNCGRGRTEAERGGVEC